MWHYIQDNQKVGPVEQSEISTLIQNGTITPQTLVWKEGMTDWQQIGQTELAACLSGDVSGQGSSTELAPYPQTPAAYQPESLRTLWLWFAWLVGVGLPLCFVVVGIFPLIAGIVIGYILLYRYWVCIRDGQVRTTPGKAVGFCFIPIFSIYWLYVAYVGLAKDMNLYCDQRQIDGPRINESLTLTWYILLLCSIVPYLGFIAFIASIVIQIIVMKQFTDLGAKILESKQAGQAEQSN